MKDNRKKTNLLINPEFQYKFIGIFIGLLILTFGLMMLVGNWIITPLFDQIATLDLPVDHEIWLIIDNFRNYAFSMSMLLFLALACLFIMIALILSHRIVGPLKNLQNGTQRMGAAKKLTKVYFRKNDFFKNLERDFNDMVDKFNQD